MIKASILLLLTLILLSLGDLAGQTIFFEETFDGPIPFPPPNISWTYNGKGEGGTYWNNREAIFSESKGGALIINADSLSEAGATGVNANFQLFSDSSILQNDSKFYLKFNQYFRNFQSSAKIEAFADTDNDNFPDAWVDIFTNDDIGQNAESSYKDVVVIEVTDYVTLEGLFIQFSFQGDYYFWIIDDIQLIEDPNSYPPQIVFGNLPGEGDFDGGLNGWSTQGIGNANSLWVWEADGKADQGAFAPGFGTQSIVSPTLGNGAMVFDSDFYDNGGIIGNEGNGPVPATQISELISPVIDLSNIPPGNITLSFNQYFRQRNSTTLVHYSVDGGSTWSDPTDVNPDFPMDTTTARTDTRQVVFSNVPNTNQFRIKFVINADYYFWVIDDVTLGINTLYPETFPPYIGDSLIQFGIPYDVDCDKGPFKPQQLIVQFKPGTSDVDKQILRDSFNVAHVDSCICSVIELWHFGPDTSSTMGLSGSGPSVGILEKKGSIGSSSEVDGSDLNRFVWNELGDREPPLFTALDSPPSNVPGPVSTLIAVLDTGVDIEHADLSDIIYVNPNETIDSLDEDGSCLVDDVVGWNFVKDNNNVQDDHSHGTHLAGIIKNNLEASSTCSDFKILPLKTHNEHGVAELFDIQCAFYYALRQGADVINCSWGWYDNDSEILNNMLDSARLEYNALAVAAAGNDTIDLNEHPQFPACSGQDNIITVGSVNSSNELSGFTNISPACIDIAAPGDSIMSTVPGDTMAIKSGTSMAAPAVVAAAASIYCANPQATFLEVKNCLLDFATEESSIANAVLDGNILSFTLGCIVSVEDPIVEDQKLTIFPNPTSGLINLLPDFEIDSGGIFIYDGLGRLVYSQSLGFISERDLIEVDLSGLVPGIYLVSLRVGESGVTRKVVVY